MAHAVFGAARLGLELVVFGLDLGVGHRRLLVHVGGEQADQDALAGDLHLLLEVVRRAEAAALGFLDQDLVGDDLVADQLVDVRRQLLAAGGGLLLHLSDDRVGVRLGHGPLTTAMFGAWAVSGASPVPATAARAMLAARKRFFMTNGSLSGYDRLNREPGGMRTGAAARARGSGFVRHSGVDGEGVDARGIRACKASYTRRWRATGDRPSKRGLATRTLK